MASLPDSLLYYTQQISNWTCSSVKLNPLGSPILQSDGTTQLRVALPVNSICNIKTFSMYAQVSTRGGVAESSTNAGDAIYVLIPKGGISALLNRVSFSVGGISLDNGFTPYYLVKQNKDNLKRGQAKYTSDDAVLSQAFLEKRSEWSDGSTTTLGMKKDLIQNNFIGFTESEPSYIDMSLMPEMYVTFNVGSGDVCPIEQEGQSLGTVTRETAAVNPQFSLENIYFTIECCTIGSGMYDQLVQRIMAERGSVDIPYKQYNTFATTVSSGNTSITGSISTMCLDRLSAVSRPNDLSAWANRVPVLCEGSTTFSHQQAAVNFDMNSTEDIQWQYRINNAPNPLFKASSIDAFNMVVTGDDRSYSSQRGGLVSSLKMWRKNCFSPTVRLCLNENTRLLSGLNVSAINCQLSYNPTNTTGGGNRELVLITEQTSVLRCSPGRAVAVIA